ncbi:MAG TPA: DUF4388 domain-containing protein, partial [Bdellovibrionota bacterium]|nr:DUF4388 domain-containing protein [Bdellovibrionota bacterium]
MSENAELFPQTFAAWAGLSASLQEGGYLEQTTIESLLLQIERQRLTGILELERRLRNAKIGFQQGFIVSFEAQILDPDPDDPKGRAHFIERCRPRSEKGWMSGELLLQILGWRSGSFRFLARDSVQATAGFPLRSGQLLTLAWLLLIEHRKRFLMKQNMFENFLPADSRRPGDQYFGEIFSARVQGKTGELETQGRGGERSLVIEEGELKDVRCKTEGSRVGDLCIRYGLLQRDQVKQLVEERGRTHQPLIELALQKDLLDESSLQLLLILQRWERIFECCHWPDLAVTWKDPEDAAMPSLASVSSIPLADSTYASKVPGAQLAKNRCRFCGADVEEGEDVCEICITRNIRMESIRKDLARRWQADSLVRWGAAFALVIGILWIWWSGYIGNFFVKHSLVAYLSEEAGVKKSGSAIMPKELESSSVPAAGPPAPITLAAYGNPAAILPPVPARAGARREKLLDRFPPFFDKVDLSA